MAYSIEFVSAAQGDLKGIKPYYRNAILDAIEQHLGHEPTRTSRSRIKRLRDLSQPQYRLRVGDYRVFYDTDEHSRTVTILRVCSKEESVRYLEELGRENTQN